MKWFIPALFCLALVSSLPVHADDAALTPTDLSEIARGYSLAFKHMVQQHTVLYYKIDGKIYSLNNIVQIDAVGAVLVIKLAGEERLAISSNCVLFLTDSAMIPPPS